jgi:outer membrane receptor protein involved in Fe transport
VELTLSKSFDQLNLVGSYSYTDAEIRSGQYSGKEIPNVAKHKANVGAEILLVKNLTLALNGIYVGKRPFDGI